MPIIPVYTAPGAAGIIRPTETGEQATNRAAAMGERRAGISGEFLKEAWNAPTQAAVSGTQEVVKFVGEHEERLDKSDKGSQLIQLHQQLQQQYDEASKSWDPQDHEAPRRFLEQVVQPAVQAWQTEGWRTTNGQDWGMQQGNNLLEHLNNVVTVDTSTRAGIAMESNAKTSLSGLLNITGQDFSTLPLSHNQWDATLDNIKSAPNMTGIAAQRIEALRNEGHVAIDESAAHGLAVANPNGLAHAIGAGTFKFANGGQLEQLALTAKRAALADQERGMVMGRMAEQQHSEAVAGDFIKNYMAILPNGEVGFKPGASTAWLAINGKTRILPSEQMAVGNALNRSRDEGLKAFDTPEATSDITQGFKDGSLTENKIDLMVASKQLTPQTGAEWNKVLRSPLVPALEDPTTRKLYDDAMKTVDMTVTGAQLGALGQFTRASDAAAAQSARLYVTGRLAALPRDQLLTALDPSSGEKSLVSAKALAVFIRLRNQFRSAYGEQEEGVNPGVTSATPSIQLNFAK